MILTEEDIEPGYCQCGKPLHYSLKFINEYVEMMIQEAGDSFISITILDVGTFRVQRHFLALHGFSKEIAEEFGFKPEE